MIVTHSKVWLAHEIWEPLVLRITTLTKNQAVSPLPWGTIYLTSVTAEQLET